MSPIGRLLGRVNLPEFSRKLIAQGAPMVLDRRHVLSDLKQLSHRDCLQWNSLGRRSAGQAFSMSVSLLLLTLVQ
jgi:hypothetical protein